MAAHILYVFASLDAARRAVFPVRVIKNLLDVCEGGTDDM
jgi:hypothetical protein